MAEHNDIGTYGENLACQYLEKKGFSILHRNWHCGSYEVDIIAKNNEYIIFAEVKTRTGTYMGQPEIFVTKQKQKNIITAAQRYIDKFHHTEEIRFDIIAIVLKGEHYSIHHIEDAYKTTWR